MKAKQSTDLEDFAVCSLQICADLCSRRGLQLIDTSIPLKDIICPPEQLLSDVILGHAKGQAAAPLTTFGF